MSKPDGPLATLALATAGGGTNWPGGSYDPETHIAYMSFADSSDHFGAGPPAIRARSDMNYMSGSAAPGARRRRRGSGAGDTRARRGRFSVQGLPLVKPPYGQISAIDLNKGEILWQIAHGETPDNIRNNPGAQGPEHSAHRQARRVRHAGDQDSGDLRRSGTTPSGKSARCCGPTTRPPARKWARLHARAQTGTPMTYTMNGKQYIVVAIGGAGFPAELIAFKLPDEEKS